jgi:hypothetical protein
MQNLQIKMADKRQELLNLFFDWFKILKNAPVLVSVIDRFVIMYYKFNF